MSDFNQRHNRFVWCDIPAQNLDRARAFYKAVLKIEIHKEAFDGVEFCVLDHKEGNGGCIILKPDEITRDAGLLVYFNVDGRIRDAAAKAQSNGGEILQPVHAIGPHGWRAILRDSEGNRVALHSQTDE